MTLRKLINLVLDFDFLGFFIELVKFFIELAGFVWLQVREYWPQILIGLVFFAVVLMVFNYLDVKLRNWLTHCGSLGSTIGKALRRRRERKKVERGA